MRRIPGLLSRYLRTTSPINCHFSFFCIYPEYFDLTQCLDLLFCMTKWSTDVAKPSAVHHVSKLELPGEWRRSSECTSIPNFRWIYQHSPIFSKTELSFVLIAQAGPHRGELTSLINHTVMRVDPRAHRIRQGPRVYRLPLLPRSALYT